MDISTYPHMVGNTIVPDHMERQSVNKTWSGILRNQNFRVLMDSDFFLYIFVIRMDQADLFLAVS